MEQGTGSHSYIVQSGLAIRPGARVVISTTGSTVSGAALGTPARILPVLAKDYTPKSMTVRLEDPELCKAPSYGRQVVDPQAVTACCERCLAEGKFSCGKCGVLRYCSRACQQAHWGAHKHLCIDKVDTFPLPDVTFKIVDPKAAPGDYSSAEEPSGYISLACPDEDIANISDGDAIVVPKQRMSVLFQYCLGTCGPSKRERLMGGWIFDFHADAGAAGFSRRDVARNVSAKYQWLYREEERASPVPQREAGASGFVMLNRRPTQGPYRISMHDLEDLVLHTLSYNCRLGVWTLGIDSCGRGGVGVCVGERLCGVGGDRRV